MLGSLRVDVTPLLARLEAGNAVAVFGGRLRAFANGPPPQITPGPVELTFSADYLTRARRGKVSAVGEFARLTGELVLQEAGFEIRVTATEDGLPLEELSEIGEREHPVAGTLPPLNRMRHAGAAVTV